MSRLDFSDDSFRNKQIDLRSKKIIGLYFIEVEVVT